MAQLFVTVAFNIFFWLVLLQLFYYAYFLRSVEKQIFINFKFHFLKFFFDTNFLVDTWSFESYYSLYIINQTMFI
jgi:hypothetical protein